MKQRTEQDVSSFAPITVRFGSTNYEIQQLPWRKSCKWREKLANELRDTALASNLTIPDGVDISAWVKTEFASKISLTFLRSPEKMVELIFDFAPYLPKEEILDAASPEQLMRAFMDLMTLAFPFFIVLGVIQEILQPTTPKSQQPLASFLN